MRFWLKSAGLLLGLAAVIGASSYATWRALRSRYAPPAVALVRVESASAGDLSETISAPGVVQPRRSVKISAKLAARIVALPVEAGDVVTAGDPAATPPVPASVLVQLDDRDLRSRLRAAKATRDALAAQREVELAAVQAQEADLTGLEAAFRQVELDHQRKQDLLSSKDVSQLVAEQAATRFEEERARLQAARLKLAAARHGIEVLRFRLEAADADIEQAEEALEYTTIRAPIDGTVTAIHAEVGELVVTGTMNNPGTVLMEIADLSSMILLAEVDEADVGKVQPGQTAVAHVQAYPETDLAGTVETIALTHRPSSRGTKYYRTEIRLDPAPVQLYSGLTADVDICTQVHRGVLTVPSQAVLGRKTDELPETIRQSSPDLDPDKTYATVVYRCLDGKAVVTPVRIGPADMRRTVILAGLAAGEAVIVGPYKVLNALSHDRPVQIDDGEPAPVAARQGLSLRGLPGRR